MTNTPREDDDGVKVTKLPPGPTSFEEPAFVRMGGRNTPTLTAIEDELLTGGDQATIDAKRKGELADPGIMNAVSAIYEKYETSSRQTPLARIIEQELRRIPEGPSQTDIRKGLVAFVIDSKEGGPRPLSIKERDEISRVLNGG